jgi:hypothetical protein
VQFEPFMSVMENLFSKATDSQSKNVARFAQAAFVGELQKRLLADVLFPYHYCEDELKKANARFNDLLERVDFEVIYNFPKLDIYHKHWLLSRKNNLYAYINKFNNNYSVFAGSVRKTDFFMPNAVEAFDLTGDPDVVFKNFNNEWFSISKSKTICQLKDLAIVITRVSVVDKTLTLYGYAKSGFYSYIDEDINLCVTEIFDDKICKRKLHTFYAYDSNYMCRTQTNKFYGFIYECDLNNVRGFLFLIEYRNITVAISRR